MIVNVKLQPHLCNQIGIKETDHARLCEQIVKTFKSENKERNN